MKNILIIIFLGLMFSGCSSIKPKNKSDDQEVLIPQESVEKKTNQSVPSWYLDPPTTNGKKFYATSSAVSKHFQLALDKAVLNAKYSLASQINSQISGSSKALVTENFDANSTRDGQNYAKIIKRELINEVKLNGFQIEKAKIKNNFGTFQAYVLLSIPIEENISKKSITKTPNDSNQKRIEKEFNKLEQSLGTKTYPVD